MFQYCHIAYIIKWMGSICWERGETRRRTTSGDERHWFYGSRHTSHYTALDWTKTNGKRTARNQISPIASHSYKRFYYFYRDSTYSLASMRTYKIVIENSTKDITFLNFWNDLRFHDIKFKHCVYINNGIVLMFYIPWLICYK